MAQKSNYILLSLGIIGIAAVAACGTIAFSNMRGSQPNNEDVISIDNTPTNPNIETNIKSNGLQVKQLNTSKNNLGQITHTFSYTITPSTATDQTVSASLAWTSSGVNLDIDDYLSVSVDTDNKTITVTALQNFANQATLTVTSNSNLLQYATVTLDCLKKFNGWNSSGTNAYGQSVSGIALMLSTKGTGNTYSNKTVNYASLPSTLTDFTLTQANTTNAGYWQVSYSDCSSGFTTVYSKDQTINLGWEINELNYPNSWSFVMYGYSSDSSTHYESAYNETSSFSSYFTGQSATMGSEVNLTGSNLNVDSIRSSIQTAISGLPNATRQALHNHYATASPGGTYADTKFFGVSTSANLRYVASTGETMTKTVTLAFIDYAERFNFTVPVTGISVETSHLDF